MEKRKAKVIMLPTEDKTAPILKYKGNCSLQYFPNTYWSNKDLTKQHLYITTDDEIKEGDWCIMFDDLGNIFSNPQQYLGKEKGHTLNKNLRKIIATTDKSLKLKCDCSESEAIYCGSRCQKSLPQPSQAFIEKYCKLGGIDEVLVEYEDNTIEFQNFCSQLGFSYDSAFGWYENLNPGHRPNTSTLEEKFNNKLKINLDNNINIHLIKEEFSKNEFLSKIKKFQKENPDYPNKYSERMIKWMEKNL